MCSRLYPKMRSAAGRAVLPVSLTFIFLDMLILFVRHSHIDLQSNRNNLASPELPSVCTAESCMADYVRLLQRKDQYPIPAIRHILWKSELVSEHFAEQMVTWSKIHPNWTYVLWRDRDLEPFVATHFPGLLTKFKSLPHPYSKMMRIDMIRYLILYSFGGVYADLDYSIVRSLDEFRRFQAVLTREPEMHSLELMGAQWPLYLLANPAFMMSAPGHTFFYYMTLSLGSRKVVPDGLLNFAGPIGLSEILEDYQRVFPNAMAAKETVYVPPSYSFYPYPENRMTNSKSAYLQHRRNRLKKQCNLKRQLVAQHDSLNKYCNSDFNNMDPLTDKSHPVFAIHDLIKTGAAYDTTGIGKEFYTQKLVDARSIIKGLMLGEDFVKSLR